ncbi:MAG: TonB-dependent receptor plug domain-containing protein [Alphaproteobacteria bacterium]|nr:TonB-dependent receptor plug domain-containing protein [Alphaproteobacteria bacterium]
MQEIQDLGGITDNIKLTNYLTGVSADRDGQNEFFIRGAGVGRVPTTDSATTQLRNGAETAGGWGGRAYLRFDMFDTKQIEVYRGPQSALYGRNAVGGVLNVVNQEPKDIFEYRGMVSYDFEREEKRFEGVVNMPVIDGVLFARAGIIFEDEEGLYYNEFLDEKNNGEETLGGRIALRATPNDWLSATLFVDHGESRVDPGFFNRSITRDPITYGAGAVDPDGNPLPATGLDPTSGDVFVQKTRSRAYWEEELTNVNLGIDVELGWATLSSTTGYRDRTFNLFSDADGTYVGGPGLTAGCRPVGMATTQMCEDYRPSTTHIFTQEVRLVAPGTNRFTWLVGADYRYLDTMFDIDRRGRIDAAMTSDNSLLETTTEISSIGAFGNISYEIFDGLTGAASIRWSREEKSFTSRRTSFDTLAPFTFGSIIGTPIDDSTVYENIDPGLSLTYKWGDQLVYASWAEAHRSGGYNQDDPTPYPECFTDNCLTFEEEQANGFEVGYKVNRLLDGTTDLAIAAFRADYDGVLVNDQVPAGSGAGFQIQYVDNGGQAYVQGVETEITSRVSNPFNLGGRLTLRGGIVFTESKITDGVGDLAPFSNDLELTRTPHWSYNLFATYRRPVPFFENSGLGLFVTTTYKSEVGGSETFGATQVPRDTVKDLDTQIGLEGETRGQSWQLTAFFNNVTDVSYERRRQPTFLHYNDPITYGLRFTLAGGEE